MWNLPSITKGIKHNPAYRLVSNVSPGHLGLCFGKGWTYLNNWNKQALNILLIIYQSLLALKENHHICPNEYTCIYVFFHKFINRQISLSHSYLLLNQHQSILSLTLHFFWVHTVFPERSKERGLVWQVYMCTIQLMKEIVSKLIYPRSTNTWQSYTYCVARYALNTQKNEYMGITAKKSSHQNFQHNMHIDLHFIIPRTPLLTWLLYKLTLTCSTRDSTDCSQSCLSYDPIWKDTKSSFKSNIFWN